MVFKINISEKNGKTYHLETESEELTDKELHNKIDGKDILNAIAEIKTISGENL